MDIRISTERDWPSIVEIYNQAIDDGNATADTERAALESRRDWFLSHQADSYPIYVCIESGVVTGWCSLSPYRPGRKALRYTAEISYYVSREFRRKRVASRLIRYAIDDCSRLGIKTLFGILLETNEVSVGLLEQLGFERWGFLPNVADFDGKECGHLYIGKRVD